MNRRIVALMVALLSPLLAVDARAELLLAVDGVELHGTVELLRSGASTCTVRESDTAYENRKANHGAPMDLWRVNAEVHNRTGRWLDRVVAQYTIRSEWPACSNWGHPEGVPLVEIVHWVDTLEFIQEVGRNVVAPGAVLTAETEYFIVLSGDPAPRFDNLWITFDLGAGGDSGSGPQAVEAALGLDRPTRRQLQRGLQAAGFNPGVADGLFGPRTRAAIRSWQRSRSEQPTGYLDATGAAALRPGPLPRRTFRERDPSSARPSAGRPAGATSRADLAFWQSISNSTNPSVFEAYLSQFPNGVFRRLAQNRLAVLGRSAASARVSARVEPVPRAETPRRTEARRSRAGRRPTSATSAVSRPDAARRPGDVFRDCAECPEMVVLAGGRLAMGRYEVTVGEYRAFASATGAPAGWCNADSRISWRDPGFAQTDRHPVTCVGWDDAQAYAGWLSRTTGAAYRLPTESEWERAASGSQPGCDMVGSPPYPDGTCPVGSHGANAAGLSDMVGNVSDMTSSCWDVDCDRRVLRGGAWSAWFAESLRLGARTGSSIAVRSDYQGFRVLRTLN